MKELLSKQKALTIASELNQIVNAPGYSHVQHIFIKYGIDRFDPIKIQELINIMGIELAGRIINNTVEKPI